ncbi:hypothetical protein LAZ40_10985 [Cereibacter sphaeroides]|uniref:hypothetical protein n=1 Tax=Cereibacter sphaeroides TaxID=1063 RepID=UPI001F3237AC|nr:hypothetical protein [Cereibacter sphaeroides]MCE6959580.1 hypothetical protein [Cereibacter sphaeroides]MCE6974560.1 hypothetical protein [Cereibacter sphaeroides]
MQDVDLSLPVRDWLPTVTYPGFRPGLPDIVLGRLPASIAAIAGQPYKSWIVESPREAKHLRARLAEPLPLRRAGALDFVAGPDSAVRRAGNGASRTDVIVALYSPPEAGWPFLLLTSLPMRNESLERGCYAWEVFEEEAAALAHAEAMISAIGSPVILLGPDSLRRS